MSVCPQTQCQSDVPKTLHSGYVAHRNRNEPPCEASTQGHNEYMRNLRQAKKGTNND